MLELLTANSGIVGWLAGAVVTVLAVAGVYLKGRSTGRTLERQEIEARVSEQAAQARQEARHVDETINSLDNDALIAAASKWVRNPGESRD